MKKLSKIVSVVLSLVLCLGMASPAFAASFTELQNAVDGVEGAGEAITGTDYTGYGKNENNTEGQGYDIWAKTDEEGTREVKLYGDVTYGGGEDVRGINIVGKSVDLDLNDHTVDGGYREKLTDENGEVTQEASAGSGHSVLHIKGKANVTIKDGTITGGNSAGSYNGDWTYIGGGVFVSDSTLAMEKVSVTKNRATSGGGIALVLGSDVTLTDVAVTGNTAQYGSGINVSVTMEANPNLYPSKTTLTMIGGEISENSTSVDWGKGGGLHVTGEDSTATLTGVKINKNTAHQKAGGVWVEKAGAVNLTDVDITNNSSGQWFGGIMVGDDGDNVSATLTMTGGSISGNSGLVSGAGTVRLYGTATLECVEVTDNVSSGVTDDNGGKDEDKFFVKTSGSKTGKLDIVHTSGTAVRENEVPATCEKDGSYDEVVYCSVCHKELSRTQGTITATGHHHVWTVTTPAGPGVEGVESLICPDCGDVLETHPIPALPVPAIPDDGGADAAPDATTTLADQEVPLAGLTPLYMLLEELRQHEEIPKIELPEDFKWIDHAYAQAIYWGLQEELVVDTEEEPLDPDAVITVAILRNVLTNFVAYKGADFVVTVEGEDDEIVFDLGERLTAFYAELEAALKAQEDKAA